ncbi:hypothetical protein [Arcticibacter tournemirensis]|uniref:Uncharacterized protein n=1 Tax=Arcticibacter tournemirensis TaxID=699437 RepID=A0A4Q0M9P7_9SPHI|nr:hypothetical protein [Arcticibacter tournemirensis]RXF69499.1 hypothetical protein EKH83_12540 [Arcticibacter tournemirensis]
MDINKSKSLNKIYRRYGCAFTESFGATLSVFIQARRGDTLGGWKMDLMITKGGISSSTTVYIFTIFSVVGK